MKLGLTFDDVLLVPKTGVLESRKDADIFSELVSGTKLEVPIVSANMPSVTATDMAHAMYKVGGFGILHRFGVYEDIDILINSFETIKDYCKADAGISLGIKNGLEVAWYLANAGCRIFCLDVAHGDHEQVIKFVKEFKESVRFNDCKLIVGNVATLLAASKLAEVGADAIKIGVGPGAACRTREVTGFGVPQLSAIFEVSRIKKWYPDVRVIADGGIKNSGDIVKALAAGADTVMIGSLLAGCDEAPNPGEYYGNASKHVNGHRAPEGSYGRVVRTGKVEDVIKELAWGIRSGVSYGGATNLHELRKNAEFIQVTAAGQHESNVRLHEPEYVEFYTDQIAMTKGRVPL